ncbi:MAG: glutathione S-transferase N-terminal domain-containing protein [Candidatus Paceibacterota bacterium]
MLTLYYKPTCPFCRRVVAVIERLELEVEKKDITADEAFAEELIAHGGKKQTPYLVDSDKDVALYESDDIVAHLQKEYGDNTEVSKPRVHISDQSCTSCEG